MPRFVVLEHDFPDLHWDLMLEVGPVLKTWRLTHPPASDGGRVNAVPIADHRLVYLDYEGPISGNRGTVKRWDWGEYQIEEGTDRIRLAGVKVQGVLSLRETINP